MIRSWLRSIGSVLRRKLGIGGVSVDFHIGSLAEICYANCAHLKECKLHRSPQSTRLATPRIRVLVPDYAVVQIWCQDFEKMQSAPRPVQAARSTQAQVVHPPKAPAPGGQKEG